MCPLNHYAADVIYRYFDNSTLYKYTLYTQKFI